MIVAVGFGLFSCKSEFEERLEIAENIQEQLLQFKLANSNSASPEVEKEIELLEEQILFHAKVSGNERLFMEQIKMR